MGGGQFGDLKFEIEIETPDRDAQKMKVILIILYVLYVQCWVQDSHEGPC